MRVDNLFHYNIPTKLPEIESPERPQHKWGVVFYVVFYVLDMSTGRNAAPDSIISYFNNIAASGLSGAALVYSGVYIVPSQDGSYSFAHEEQVHTGNVINNNLIELNPRYGNINYKV